MPTTQSTQTGRARRRDTPAHTMTSFVECVHAGDLDGLMSLYAPDAVLQPSDGGVFSGTDEIRTYLGQLMTLNPRMKVEPVHVLETAATALVVNEWSMRGTAPDGSAVERSGRSADVLRRQDDGGWLVLIDHP